MRRVVVREEDGHGHLTKAWFARSAIWWPDDRVWSFFTGVQVSYKNGEPDAMKQFDFDGTGKNRKDEEGWSETPWILMSGALQPDFLGVPQLISYMRANQAYGTAKLAPFRTHLFYRFAQPWQAFIVVLAAAPLGVVFSRRGMLGGVAGSIFIFFFLIFIDHLFLNLGKGRHLPASLSVWMPHLILGGFGIYLFKLRSQNRDLPRLKLRALIDGAASLWRVLRQRPKARPAA
jgi:lipopolysaccharide export LptBFGC system permease protein LptF